MPEWRFEKKRRSQKTRNPMQASFFTNESIDDDCHALVREAIQNSLDAGAVNPAEPVRIRFTLGQHAAGSELLGSYISDDAWVHFHADDNGLRDAPGATDDCRYLVFEDFNTTGLIGDEKAHEEEKGNAFYYFLRAEGQSGKDEGDRGRHGIGKYVFPRTSRIRTFFALSVRSEDGRCLTCGQSILNTHTVDDEVYTPDGWWGEFASDDFQLPVDGVEQIEGLSRDFSITRKAEESGLSIVVPYIADEISSDLISQHVIAEYFLPILQGHLVVEVADGDTERLIDADGLRNSLESLLSAKRLKDLAPYIALAIATIDTGATTIIDFPVPDSYCKPVWSSDLLDKASATRISKSLETATSVVHVRVPVCVKPENADYDWSVLDLYLRREEDDARRKPLFVREGITIPEDRIQSGKQKQLNSKGDTNGGQPQ